MVKTRKANRPLPITQNMGFSETFLFSKITFWKKKTLTSLANYSTLFSSTGMTFQCKEKYSILQLEYSFLNRLYNDLGLHAHRLDLLEFLVDACYR